MNMIGKAMCQAISGIGVLTGDTIKVYTSRKTDSHIDIRKEYNIRDDSLTGVASHQTPVELIPVESLTDINGMRFKFDNARPNWWTDSMTDEAIKQLHSAWMERFSEDGNIYFCGDLNLLSLTELNVPLTVTGGDLNLSSLTELNVPLTVTDGYLNLRNLIAIPKDLKVKAKIIYLKNQILKGGGNAEGFKLND